MIAGKTFHPKVPPPEEKSAAPQRRYVICTKHGRKKDTRHTVYSVMSGFAWRNGLEPSTQLVHVHD
jgi:hypothetical protein